jgi:hypothetical protein
MIKKIALGLLIILVALQFIRPTRNSSTIPSTNDIRTAYVVPENVLKVFEKSCYDCHSNNSAYPWYTNIQPIGLWMQQHIDEGKDELNFSEFKSYSIKRQLKKMKEIRNEINEDEMPLSSYLIIHRDANLNNEQKINIIDWTLAMEKELATSLPKE